MQGKVLHDHVLVEIKKSEFVTSGATDDMQEDPKAGSGIVVAVPGVEDIMYFSSYSWILENSMLNEGMAKRLHEKMSALIGKKVYWEKRADIGNTIEDGDRTFATIKFTKLIYVEE